MSFKIDKTVIKATTECRHDFMCQTSADVCFCFIKRASRAGLHIEQRTHKQCPYMETMDKDFFVCTCPTRNEIHRLYKL